MVVWSNIPLGPAGTTARNLYTTVSGDTGLPLFVATLSNNTANSFTTSLADANLGAAPPVPSVTAITLFGNPLPGDDLRFVPVTAPRFLLVTDPSSNQIHMITAPWRVDGRRGVRRGCDQRQ